MDLPSRVDPTRHSGPMTPTRGSHQRTTGRLGAYAASLLLLAPLTACGTGDGEPAAEPPGPARTSATAGPAPSPNGDRTDDPTDAPATGSTDAGEDETGPGPEADLPPVRDRVSLPALMREEVRGSGLRPTRQLAETDRWTGYAATYQVNGATVSGELLVPKGRGPFPALVLNHGYIDPDVYVLGQGMSREQEWFAAAGFVVLHTDYRGHAGSDPVTEQDRESRLVYTRDAIGAVKALERMPYVDADRTAYVGRSMGGGVTLNAIVAEPDLVDAAVVFASVSSSFVDNLRQFTEPNRPDGARVLRPARHPAEQPAFLRRALQPHLLRPRRGPGAAPPRHRRRHLPDCLVARDRPAAHPRRRRLHAGGVAGGGARLRSAVRRLDAPYRRFLAPPPRRLIRPALAQVHRPADEPDGETMMFQRPAVTSSGRPVKLPRSAPRPPAGTVTRITTTVLRSRHGSGPAGSPGRRRAGVDLLRRAR